jgi:trk system potassium uptake protein TrkH
MISFQTFLSRHLSPERILILAFAATIMVGAVLFRHPWAAARDSLSFIDALFTATSAVCVTGLTVLDLGQDLSLAGQVLSLILFQLGGLGIITFSTVFFVLMGRGISFKGREIVQSTFLHTPREDLFSILKSILWYAFFFEALGTLFLWIRFSQDFSLGRGLYQAVYHAVSAFNNCGFSLFSDSLVRYQGDLLVNLTVMGLIFLGSIGFVVQYEFFSILRGARKRFSLHAKLTLVTSVTLILLGAFFFYISERDQILQGHPATTQTLISFFQSLTPRTCGFNTVEIGRLMNATVLLLMILMFIGGSPGSTAGGIKTTSAALLVSLIWNRLRGNETVNIFRRTLPHEVMSRAISIILASGFVVFLVSSVLLLLGDRTSSPLESRQFFVQYVFEAISAFGTVGLSMGATASLNPAQKIAIILLMFAGRVGPLTLAFSFSRRVRKEGVSFAEESVMVG